MQEYLNGWTIVYGQFFDVDILRGAERRAFKTLREARDYARTH